MRMWSARKIVPLLQAKFLRSKHWRSRAYSRCSAFMLVLQLNALTVKLSVVALALAVIYPFLKRVFWLPQAWLGIAFGFGIPMTFAAQQNWVPPVAWALLAANVFWAIAYDTEYAMVDREDDVKLDSSRPQFSSDAVTSWQ